MNKLNTYLFCWCAFMGMAITASFPALGDAASAENSLKELITKYAMSIDRADTTIADEIFSNAPEVTFIHPRGEERGRKQIEDDLYKN